MSNGQWHDDMAAGERALRERDEARAEVERLRAERDEARAQIAALRNVFGECLHPEPVMSGRGVSKRRVGSAACGRCKACVSFGADAHARLSGCGACWRASRRLKRWTSD